jgi:hypothetical protein
MTIFINNAEARTMLQNCTDGTIFTVTFIKRTDGTKRVMKCRKGVKKGTTGQGMSFFPGRDSLLPVYDVKLAQKLKNEGNNDDKAYRFISLEKILQVEFKGNTYIVK